MPLGICKHSFYISMIPFLLLLWNIKCTAKILVSTIALPVDNMAESLLLGKWSAQFSIKPPCVWVDSFPLRRFDFVFFFQIPDADDTGSDLSLLSSLYF